VRRLSLFPLFLVAATAGAGLALAVDGLVPDAPAPVRPI
jgi:hypothetical protein